MRRSTFFLIVCALFLLGAQQASFVHGIGHIGPDIRAASAAGEDGDSGDKNTLFGECKTCLAFAALNAAPPVFMSAIAEVEAPANAVREAAPADVPGRCASCYKARAPPVLL